MDQHDAAGCGSCTGCGGCGASNTEQPVTDRRAFLRTALLGSGALLALGLGSREAAALPVRFVAALSRLGNQHAYALPPTDGVYIDRDQSVMIARVGGKAYAFSLACPHQNTALRWNDSEHRFECPKHHSKYSPDGVYLSGRATRSMDRFALRREGGQLMVDLDNLYREDHDHEQWAAAFVTI